MPPQTVSVSEVPEEVLPLLDRTRVCSASDAVGNFVIWYSAISAIEEP